jgi:hypothetical protein
MTFSDIVRQLEDSLTQSRFWWNDEVSVDFEKNYMRPLFSQLRLMEETERNFLSEFNRIAERVARH